MTVELWDRPKLLRFIKHFNIGHKMIAAGIGVSTNAVDKMATGRYCVERHSIALTDFKNNLIRTREEELRDYVESMVKYYKTFI